LIMVMAHLQGHVAMITPRQSVCERRHTQAVMASTSIATGSVPRQ